MEKLQRDFNTDNKEIDDGLYTFSVASSEPYERTREKLGTYNEVLMISEDAIDFTRLVDQRCPFLLDHDQTKQIGVVEKAYILDNKLYVDVRFSDNSYAQRTLNDIKSGIRRNTSIGYAIDDYQMIAATNGSGIPTMLVTKWLPYECSTVACPADVTVGYQRSLETNMEEENKKIVEETEEQKAAREAEERVKAEEEQRKLEEQKKLEEEAKAKREAEISEIRSLGELTNNSGLAENFIKENKSYNDFKEEVRKLKEKLNVKEIKNMDNEKKERFSLLKALAINTSHYKGNPEETYEWKVIEENKKNLGITDADIVVTRENLRAFPNGSESLNQVVYRPDMYTENLRPESVVAKTGCRVVDVDGPSISFSVCTSGITAGFVDLNGEIPSADMSWSLKTINPAKAGAFTQIDYRAILQDRPSVEAIVMDDIVRGLDQAVDEAIIMGDGTSNKPTGVLNTSGVNEVPASALYTLSGAYEFEKGIRDSNDYADNLVWVMNSTDYYKYATTPYSATEQNRMLLDEETRKIIGHPVVICNALTTGDVILGNFAELLVAVFDGIRLKVVEDAQLSRKGAVEVQAFEAVNCLVRRPKSFSVAKHA